jgi:hypothetical protein
MVPDVLAVAILDEKEDDVLVGSARLWAAYEVEELVTAVELPVGGQ